MLNWQKKFIEKYYRSRNEWIDGTTEFHNLCKKYISSNHIVLELGAGPSNKTSKFLSANSRELHGIDINSRILENGYLSKVFLYDGTKLPFDDNCYDVVCSDYVNEHLENPQRILYEIHRVLKASGKYIFRTPNIYHYVSLFSRFSPLFIHKALSNKVRNRDSNSNNVYKTFYRSNSKRVCCNLLNNAGFDILEFRLIEKEPSYGMSLKTLFYIFMLYERLLNSSEFFQSLRANILCVARKV